MNEKYNIKNSYADSYVELKFMGRGKSGSVYLVRHKVNQKLYVAKKIELTGLSKKEVESALNEVVLCLIIG